MGTSASTRSLLLFSGCAICCLPPCKARPGKCPAYYCPKLIEYGKNHRASIGGVNLRWTRAKRKSAERNWFRLNRRREIGSDSLVLEEGIEPTRPCGHRILSPARLPVPPLELQKARPSRLACGDAYAQGA